MLDEPIDVLDSYIHIVDFEKAAAVIADCGRCEVPAEIRSRGRFAANLWRCGRLLEPDDAAADVFRLRYTSEPGASKEAAFHGIFYAAYFIAEAASCSCAVPRRRSTCAFGGDASTSSAAAWPSCRRATLAA